MTTNIKKLRIKMGYTQKQLGERIGISQVYISKIEKGDIDGLTLRKFFKLASALNITPEEFIGIIKRLKRR